MTTREYSQTELMEHLKGAAENGPMSPMKLVCAESYDEIDRLTDAIWEYGQHRARCGIGDGKECDCGFFDIIKTLKE